MIRSQVGGGGAGEPLVDLQYRLIRAASHEAAYSRALELGHRTGLFYGNAEGETVTWEFSGLHDLREIHDASLADGVEVYSHLVRRDPGHYVVPKERLTVFWAETNKGKTAQELLDDE